MPPIPTTTTINFSGSGSYQLLEGVVQNGVLKTVQGFARIRVNFNGYQEVSNATFRATSGGISATASLVYGTQSGTISESFTPESGWNQFSDSQRRAYVTSVDLLLTGNIAQADDLTITYRPIRGLSDHTALVGKTICLNGPNASRGGDGTQHSPHAISIRYGEKREDITDLTVRTPFEPLQFTRYYRQFMQVPPHYRAGPVLGLGWFHSHFYHLVRVSTEGYIYIMMPDGGDVYLDETARGGAYYRGRAGFQAELTLFDGNPLTCLMKTQDGHQYYFTDDNGRLLYHEFPNGARWRYTYVETSDAFDRHLLRSVRLEDYNQKLQFVYYNAPGTVKHRQIWRVGDGDATGLNSDNPTGRYLEFDYVNGGGRPLLSLARSLTGEEWRYTYYPPVTVNGHPLCALKNVQSPQTQTVSNNFVMQRLTQKNLEYGYRNNDPNQGLSWIKQKLGLHQGAYLIEEKYDFYRAGGTARTEVTVADRKTQYHFDYGIHYASEDGESGISTQSADAYYRINQVVDANTNASQLTWTANGGYLAQTQDAENQVTKYKYSDGTLNAKLTETEDALGRITRYFYRDSRHPRLPNVVRVFSADNVLLRETHLHYNAKGQTRDEIHFDPADGRIVWQSDPTQYTAVAIRRTNYAYAVSGSANWGMLIRTTQIDVLDPTGNIDTLYSYDSRNRVIRTQKTSVTGGCEYTHTVYDLADNILATVCGWGGLANIPDNDATPLETLYDPLEPDKYKVTIYSYDPLGRRIEERTNVGSPQAQTKRIYYDSLDRVIRTITNYVAIDNAEPGLWIWNDRYERWETDSAIPISHGPNNDQNLIEDRTYNALGQLFIIRDTLGRQTLYGYDKAGRVKLVKENASGGLSSIPTFAADWQDQVSLDGYRDSASADVDVNTRTVYDKAGNIIRRVNAANAMPENRITEYKYNKRNQRIEEIISPVADDLPNAAALRLLPDHQRITRTRYDAVGRLQREMVQVDNRLTSGVVWKTRLMGYDGLNRVVCIIDNASNPNYVTATNFKDDLSTYAPPSGVIPSDDQDIVSRIVYDEHGRVKYEETEAGLNTAGLQTWYAYDGQGHRIKTIVAPSNPAADPRQDSYVPSSEPDKDLITRTIYDANGRIQREQDVQGRWTLRGYNRGGRQVCMIQNASHPDFFAMPSALEDLSNYGPLSTDSDQDQITRTNYDTLGRVKTVTDPQGSVTYTVYDGMGRTILTVQNYTSITGLGLPESWRWENGHWQDDAQQPVPHGDAQNQNLTTQTTYDVLGRMTAQRAADGRLTRYILDGMGRVVKTIDNYVDGVFDPTMPHEDLITLTEFDKMGQVIRVTDPLGKVTQYVYDEAGRRVRTIEAVGTTLETTTYVCYDKIGRVLRTIQNYVPGSADPEIRNEDGSWAFAPMLHGVDNDENLITDIQYDLADRPIQVTDPKGNITTSAYHRYGKVSRQTDAMGVVTAFGYDGVRRLKIVVQNYVETGATAPDGWMWNEAWKLPNGTPIGHNAPVNDTNIIVQMTYDKGGRMLSRRDPRGLLTTFTYDRLDRRIMLTNPLNQTWNWQYQNLADGQTRVSLTYPGGVPGPQRTYDRLGRLVSVIYDNADTPNVRFTYDLAGSRTTMRETTTGGQMVRHTRWTYTARRLAAVAIDRDGNGQDDETLSYQQNANGQRTRLTLPGDLAVISTYDARGRLTQVTDWSNQQVALSYDRVGRLKRIDRPGEIETTLAYDAAGGLTTLRHEAGASLLAQFDYTLNGRGHRAQAVEQMRRVNGTVQTRTLTYAYDALARLTESITPEGTYTYGYDLSGGRLSEGYGGVTRTFSYNAANQLISDGEHTYTYDPRGNLLTKMQGATVIETSTYDRANRLLSVDGTNYRYDGDGQRIRQTVGGTVTEYLVDAAAGLPVVVQATRGSAVTRSVHAVGGVLSEQNPDGTWEWLLRDGLGSVRSVTDAAGAVLETVDYSPYGVPTAALTRTAYGFTGEMTDTNGRVYLRARYYHPTLGTFPTLDPLEGAPERPLSLHGYSWVEGNTVNATDPTGEQTEHTYWLNSWAYNPCSPTPTPSPTQLYGTVTPLPSVLPTFSPTPTDSSTLTPSVQKTPVALRTPTPYFATPTPSATERKSTTTPQPTVTYPKTWTPSPTVDLTRTTATPTRVPQPVKYLTLGIRIDLNLYGGAKADANLEGHCSIVGCAWFATVSQGAEVISQVGAETGFGVVAGLISWPTTPGTVSDVNSAGGGITVPHKIVGLAGDATWDPRSGDTVLQIGGTIGSSVSPLPVGGSVMTGKSIYLGNDLFNVPPEIWALVLEEALALGGLP